MNKHFLYPGTLFASNQPYEIATILGSCVAVCLFDTKLHIGGMNHYLLPEWNGKENESLKYGNSAILKLIHKLEYFGSQRTDLIAKIFGGGAVIQNTENKFNIGLRNVEIAIQTLKEKKINILNSSIGGNYGRKIIYYTQTGEVIHRLIQNNSIQ